MAGTKGFTLIEILVVLVVIGILLAIALPNYGNNMVNTKVQAVENNLRAIAAAEQKYNEDNGSYYASNSFASINSNLSLSMASVNDGFTYTCLASGTCSASNPSVPAASLANQVSINASGTLTCFNSGNSVNCP